MQIEESTLWREPHYLKTIIKIRWYYRRGEAVVIGDIDKTTYWLLIAHVPKSFNNKQIEELGATLVDLVRIRLENTNT